MVTPWRERKLRCKLDIHVRPPGAGFGSPYCCKLCGAFIEPHAGEG